MPVSELGQLITFAIQYDDDQEFESWRWEPVRKHETVRKLAARLGHPEYARRIADKNGLRSVDNDLTTGKVKRKRLRVPGQMSEGQSFSVLAGDTAPIPTGGYAKFGILPRPQRTGLSTFEGYDPFKLRIPVRFEAVAKAIHRDTGKKAGFERYVQLGTRGADVERDIALLERMAGRGNFAGAAVGPPPVIKVSVTGSGGQVVPLVPQNYQWDPQNPAAPLWRVADIEWDEDPLRNDYGNRIRQLAVVVLQQHIKYALAQRSVVQRAKKPKKKPAKKAR